MWYWYNIETRVVRYCFFYALHPTGERKISQSCKHESSNNIYLQCVTPSFCKLSVQPSPLGSFQIIKTVSSHVQQICEMKLTSWLLVIFFIFKKKKNIRRSELDLRSCRLSYTFDICYRLKRERERKKNHYLFYPILWIFVKFFEEFQSETVENINVTFLDYFSTNKLIFKIIHLLNYYIYLF